MSTPAPDLSKPTVDRFRKLREVHAEEITWRDQRIKRLEELLAQLAAEVDRLGANGRTTI